MKVLCIGHTTYDVTYYFEHYPEENTKSKTIEKLESPGGGSFNMAALLTKWGIDVKLLSVIGNDMYGRELIKFIQGHNLSEDYIQKNDGNTTLASIVCNATNSSRTIVFYGDENLQLNDTIINFNPNLIIGDGYFADHFIKAINEFPDAISMVDAGRHNEETIAVAKVAKYVVASKVFAEKHTGMNLDLNNKENVINIFNKLAEDFPGCLVITLEKAGSIIKLEEQIYLIPSINVHSVDTNGAGDIYHGAFAYGLTQGWNLAKIMKFANITGALSTTKKGSFYAIPTLEEVTNYYEQNS